jgi:hypothetical protein
MKYRFGAALLTALLLATPGMANDGIPPDLIGIWASEGSAFNDNHALFEGQGIYLRADGRGMLIGGPPPIGVLFISRYDEQRKALVLRFFFEAEEPGECVDGELTHDPTAETLDIGVKLHRRIADIPPDWEEYLGRKAVPCSW